MMKRWMIASGMLGLCVMMSNGCSQTMSDAFFAESVAESKTLHKLTRDELSAHDTNMTGQHAAMSPEAADEIAKLKAIFDAKVIEIEKKAEAVHSKVGEIVRDRINRFAGMDDGEPITNRVATVVGAESKMVQDVMVAGIKKVNADIDARVAQLGKEIALKLGNVKTERLVELEKLKGDDKAFREMLQQEAKLSDAEMEALKGFSTEELLAMLLAAGGATAAGGALGKTGKSRAQPQIDAINAKIGGSGGKTA